MLTLLNTLLTTFAAVVYLVVNKETTSIVALTIWSYRIHILAGVIVTGFLYVASYLSQPTSE